MRLYGFLREMLGFNKIYRRFLPSPDVKTGKQLKKRPVWINRFSKSGSTGAIDCVEGCAVQMVARFLTCRNLKCTLFSSGQPHQNLYKGINLIFT